jgi:hypothetical protein
MSTNKVYGDRPNTIALKELETRWDYADPAYAHGISEDFSIDQSKHSLFGASKVAADVIVQEYGPNSLDMQGIGSAQPVNGVAQNCYDNLVRFKRKKIDDVTTSFDITEVEPALAEMKP